jgi:cytochrome c-type biogenesis protein CcmH/NrfG
LNAFFITQYLWLLGAILTATQRYEEAEEALHQALTHDPKQVPIYGNLAELALQRGYNGQIVLDYLEKAFELNAKLPEKERTKMLSGRMLKAWALSRLGERKAAFELMQEVFSEAQTDNVPMMGELHYLSGRIAMEQGKIVTAQSAFHKSLQLDPEGMYSQLAKTMLQQL